MKSLYHKGTVHPSPPTSSALPRPAILTGEDKEVLAYLLSCSAANIEFSDHHPSSTCYCFNCYTSFWVRWDSSPNRQVIHDIIDDFERGFFAKRDKRRNKRKNRNGDNGSKDNNGLIGSGRVEPDSSRVESEEEDGGEFGKRGDETGAMRKIMGFIGDRLWGSILG